MNILITGTSSGFGRLTAETLAKHGHSVFASMRALNGKNAECATELLNWAKTNNASLEVLELDVTDDKSVKNAVSQIINKADSIDVVVNNAGIFAAGVTEAFNIDDFRAIFEVNLYGTARVNNAVLPQMRQQGSGLLIQISSTIGRVIFPFAGAYCASKFAVEALAESYHYDLSLLGIESIIVEPGAFPTEIASKMLVPSNEKCMTEYDSVNG